MNAKELLARPGTWLNIILAIGILIWIVIQISWGTAYVGRSRNGEGVINYSQQPAMFICVIASEIFAVGGILHITWKKIQAAKSTMKKQ